MNKPRRYHGESQPMKMLDRNILSALRPSQERAKLCLTPAKAFAYDSQEHLDCALRVMSETDHSALTEDMARIAAAAAAMQKARDELAALTNKWDTSAIGLDDAEQSIQNVIAELQSAVRKHYAQIYIP